MRPSYLLSLVFAMLTSISLSINAATTPKIETSAISTAKEVGLKSEALRVDLNKADATTLQRDLVGIGEARAQAIVAYREINGPFAFVEELLEVKGIGRAILDKNRERLWVN